MVRQLNLICLLTALLTFSSCSDDSDETNPGNNIYGKWICVSQTFSEKGYPSETDTYDNDDYSLTFNEDGTGSLTHGENGLLEISNVGTFKWIIEDGKIISNIYGYEVWEIVSISADKMTLLWDDDEYKITARFIKYKEKEETGYDRNLTASSLVGRWAIITAFSDFENKEYKFTFSDKEIASGNIFHYFDFYSDGTGYMSFVGGQILFYSSSCHFSWKLDKDYIGVRIPGYDNYLPYKVVKYDGNTLSIEFDGSKATLKRTGMKF